MKALLLLATIVASALGSHRATAQISLDTLGRAPALQAAFKEMSISGPQNFLRWFDSRNTAYVFAQSLRADVSANGAIESVIVVSASPRPDNRSGTRLEVVVEHERGEERTWHITINGNTQRIALIARDPNDLPVKSAKKSKKRKGGMAGMGGGGGGSVHRFAKKKGASPTAKPTPIEDVGDPDPRLVEFLYATTRQSNLDARQVFYGSGRSRTLLFGAASVRIPEMHRTGNIELPQDWKYLGITLLKGTSDEKLHFTVRSVGALTPEEWTDIARKKGAKDALIFVHGFNNTFLDSLYRSAQIFWDMDYRGLPILYSWAAKGGSAFDYVHDRESASHARTGFIALLRKLKDEVGVEHVHVLAHSMGNQLVLDALSNHANVANPVRLAELLMAAPDVDEDNYAGQVPEVQKIVESLTLYASSADWALAASRTASSKRRAGDVAADGPILLPNVEAIDVSAMGQEMFGLNHNTFASDRSLISDIRLLVINRMRASQRPALRSVPEKATTPKYWMFAK
jgi:esterase/lipase superfamily enzyme